MVAISTPPLSAQIDLESELDEREFASERSGDAAQDSAGHDADAYSDLPAFAGTSLLHLPSTEAMPAGTLESIFYHRFGNSRNFLKDLGGLDNGARIMIALDYAFTDRFVAGISRSGTDKTWELRSRGLLLEEGPEFPYFSLAFAGAVGYQQQEQTVQLGTYFPSSALPQPGPPALNTLISQANSATYELTDHDRTSLAVMAPISKRITPWLAVQITPMFVHRNFVPVRLRNDRYGLGFGLNLRLSEKLSLVVETIATNQRDYVGADYRTEDQRSYGNLTQFTAEQINSSLAQNPENINAVFVRNVLLDRPVDYTDTPFSIGFDIDTGGHIFQLFVTNNRNMAYTRLLRGADFDYRSRAFAFAFNISRRFWFGDD